MLMRPRSHYYGSGMTGVDSAKYVAATELSERWSVSSDELSVNLSHFNLRKIQAKISIRHDNSRTFYLRSDLENLCEYEDEAYRLILSGEFIRFSMGSQEFNYASFLLSKSSKKNRIPENLLWLPCAGTWTAPRLMAQDFWLRASALGLSEAIRRRPARALELSKRGPA